MFLKTCYNGATIMSLAVTLEINKKFLPLNLFGIMNTYKLIIIQYTIVIFLKKA